MACYYDGKDLETLDLRLLRRQIGTVLETRHASCLAHFDNIAGSTPLTRDQVTEATRLAGLDADVAAMPMGLETFRHGGGPQLWAGNANALMIARALVTAAADLLRRGDQRA